MIYIIEILIYLMSVYLMWRYVKISHSKGGRWSNLTPTFGDVILTFFPVINTVGVVSWYIMSSPKEGKRNYNKFFKIKK